MPIFRARRTKDAIRDEKYSDSRAKDAISDPKFVISGSNFAVSGSNFANSDATNAIRRSKFMISRAIEKTANFSIHTVIDTARAT